LSSGCLKSDMSLDLATDVTSIAATTQKGMNAASRNERRTNRIASIQALSSATAR
jgi:hypothetical protein